MFFLNIIFNHNKKLIYVYDDAPQTRTEIEKTADIKDQKLATHLAAKGEVKEKCETR